jgi:hypothetical protein
MDTVQWVRQVNKRVMRTDERYRSLYRPGLAVLPVPMFGRLEEAQVLTLGVNPSCGEFYDDRWAGVRTVAQQADKLTRYFENVDGLPHPWFQKWESALEEIDASYRPGKKYLAAHIDLSPRATRPMRQVDQKLLLSMVVEDLGHCVDALNRAKKLRLLLIAGSVTGRYYINEFLQERLPVHGMALEGRFLRLDHPGKGKVFHHSLVIAGRKVPVFFCSSSPSSGQSLLKSRVWTHRDRLKRALT